VEYRSTAGKFSAEFPGKPKEDANDYGGYSEVKVRVNYPGDSPQTTIEVEVWKSKLGPAYEASINTARVARKATYPGSEEVNVRKITLGEYSGQAWDLKLPGDKGVIKYSMYVVKDQTYLLTAGPTGPITEADADRFLKSFKLAAP
jgi:hypothetical protein